MWSRGWTTLAVVALLAGPPAGGQAVGDFDRAQDEPRIPISATLAAHTVTTVGSVVRDNYFDPAIGERVDAMLREALRDRRYATAIDASTLAALLTRDLFAATHDKHLAVTVLRDTPVTRERTPEEADRSRALVVRRANGGVRRVEILDGNVGYLDLSSFFRPEEARNVIAAAMRLLARADALILDMRANSGGSPGTVALLVSYLFDEPAMPLFDIVHRPPDGADRYTTEPALMPEHDGARPVYVLTSARTFSAAEGLAFLLQERRRAEIVGEVTAGAANPGRPYGVNDRFTVTVPNGRVRSAVGGANWEGTGVTPDVKAAAADALSIAHARARARLRPPDFDR
jgi:C-terminal processing protease CtpA/Prc